MNSFKNLSRPDDDPEYKKQGPPPLREFRELRPEEPINLPELAENRKCTDIVFLVLFFIFMFFWTALSIYIIITAEPAAFFNAKDRCGNICGFKNEKVKSDSFRNCRPLDYSDKPLGLFEFRNTSEFDEELEMVTCVKENKCKPPKREKILGMCYVVLKEGTKGYTKIEEAKATKAMFADTLKCIPVMIGMTLIGIGFCILLYFCFYRNAKATFWTVYIVGTIMTFLTAAVLWFMAYLAQWDIGLIISAAVTTILGIVLVIIAFKAKKRIRFLIMLLEITMEAVFHFPVVLALPFLTFLFFVGMVAALIYLAVLAIAVDGEIDIIRMVYLVITLFGFYWLSNLGNGCQIMTFAGGMAAYYFARNKADLKNPYGKSICIMLKFHLGSIAAGSLIIALIQMFKLMLSIAAESDNVCCQIIACICQCICSLLEEILEYLAKKAYILIAIHGKSLYRSGVRAARLLWHFLMDTLMVDVILQQVIGAFVLMLVILTGLLGFAFIVFIMRIEHFIIPVVLGFLITLYVTFIYLSAINLTIETIFLCVCEDLLLNDGSGARPYYMPTKLQVLLVESMDVAQKELAVKEEKKRREQQERDRNS